MSSCRFISVIALAMLGAAVPGAGRVAAADPAGQAAGNAGHAGRTLALHPDNPRYFIWRGTPTILIGSGEHYGAVLNGAFDYKKYLETLNRSGLNHTRLFTGLYVEDNGALPDSPQAGNTLDPAPGQLLCPFARSDTPGYPKGGNKFDLTRWDDAYLDRLANFVSTASDCGVVVEVCLFCPYYDDRFNQWKLSPFNADNNVNGLGPRKSTDVFTLDRSDGLLAVQEAMVRRIVARLRDADNVYYEICNEPYGSVPDDWQRHIANLIVDAEAEFPNKHLISQNVDGAKVENPNPAVSIFNFHYAKPELAKTNYGLNKPLGDDETGFKGTTDAPYRREAWEFVMAGGALFSHLDYSFTVGHEDGTFPIPAGQWGGGGPSLRRQLRCLKEFMGKLPFVRMVPDEGVVSGGLPAGMIAKALAEPGKSYAVYVGPNGEYSVRWTSSFTPPRSETVTFHTVSEGGVRLRIGGMLVVDNWTPHAQREDSSGAVALVAGQAVEISMEYAKGAGVGSAKLFWTGPSRAKEVLPAEFLTPPEGSGKGFKAEYFAGLDFDRHRLTRTDAVVDFYWGSGMPFRAPEDPMDLAIELPLGTYTVEWVDTLTGEVRGAERLRHGGGPRKLRSPPFEEDIALRVLTDP